MKTTSTLVATLLVAASASAQQAGSQIFAVAGASASNPTLGLSKQDCASANYKQGMRAFVIRPKNRAVEACWNFTAGTPMDNTGVITVCVLEQNVTTAPLGNECYTLSAMRFKEVQLPSY